MSIDSLYQAHMLGQATRVTHQLEHGIKNIYLSIPDVAEYGATVLADRPHTMEPHALYVEPYWRGNSLGERLVRELATQAKNLDIQTLRGHVESEYALDIKAQVFGSAALRYFDYEPYGEEIELPLSFEQARQSLVRAKEFEKDLDYREIGFTVEVDISGEVSK